MHRNIMPRIGKNLENLNRYERNHYETHYLNLDEFTKLIKEDSDTIIAVEITDYFINNFVFKEEPSFLIHSSKYLIFDINKGINKCHFADSLKAEYLVDNLYVITPSYLEMEVETINEVLTISEAASIWGKDTSTLRRAIQCSKFKIGVDYRKSGTTWLITKKSMVRVYGKPNNG